MKAILTSFGRRANVDRREAPEASYHFKPAVASSSSHTPTYRTSYSSSTGPGGGIGDAPSPAIQRAVKDARPSGSSSRLPSHPPSSYRKPSRPTSNADGVARGLVGKLSTAHSRDASPSQYAASASRGSADLTSASRPGSAGSRSSSTSRALHPNSAFHPTLHTRAISPSSKDAAGADLSGMTSAELAARLNELAVANADGLLTDSEYRILRQAVFDRMMRAEQRCTPTSPASAPLALSLTGSDQNLRPAVADDSVSSNARLSSDLLDVDTGRSRSSLGFAASISSSIRSGHSGKPSSFQNVTRLFKGQAAASKATQQQSSQESHASQDSLHRSATGRSKLMRVDSISRSSQLSNDDGQSHRASSFRTQQSSAAKSSRLSTFGRLRANSQARREQAETSARDMEDAFSAERTAYSLRAVSLYDASDVETTGNNPPASARMDVAPTSLFGAEYVGKHSREIRAEISVVQAEGNRMLATFAALEETLMAKHSNLEPLVRKDVAERARASNPLACVSCLDLSDGSHARRPSRPPPPSSYRSPRTAPQASGLVSPDSSFPMDDDSTSADVTAFETELIGIYTQKAAVVKRYQDRLAFLQSKLRSATIREGLK
ncbi:hypothetical protein PSEUBRA_000864 [Kalmanozyma brasiliensis GHG001]|uniref:uncharacterized protein n=1 Tax=Kalmanozyma brasiliensis (strain GHG001) TaxID=1365824 RepID=UPI001CE862A7|nr:uncharacterized protein PSEUBRA_000864 [Kalmanozyma brasiliensis GHG001]KAF6766854.1 hypothetical protein PSEUBRA_000864 [Kalmanozyma brasiliensis GHG001]